MTLKKEENKELDINITIIMWNLLNRQIYKFCIFCPKIAIVLQIK